MVCLERERERENKRERERDKREIEKNVKDSPASAPVGQLAL